MNEAGAPSPYDAPDLYDILFDSLDFDIPFWLEVGRKANGPVLDVGCGTGRVLLRLLEAGIDADGIDLSEAMIGRLRQRAAAKKLTTKALVADMRDFTMPRRYARAICAFNSFAHCDSTNDQISALRCVREHLIEGGALVLHMSYPSPRYWAEPDGEPVLEMEKDHPERVTRIQIWDTRTKDVVGQRQLSQNEIRELKADGRVVATHRFATSQRWVYRYELELLFRAAGYARWQIQGDFEGKPFTDASQQMLAWAWKS
jgi:SAM-dependent methyltransferase